MMKVRTKMGCRPYVQSERQAQGLYMKYAKKLGLSRETLTIVSVIKNVWKV